MQGLVPNQNSFSGQSSTLSGNLISIPDINNVLHNLMSSWNLIYDLFHWENVTEEEGKNALRSVPDFQSAKHLDSQT